MAFPTVLLKDVVISRRLALLLAILSTGAVLVFLRAPPADISVERQLVLARHTLLLGIAVGLLAAPVGLFLAVVWLKTNLVFRRAGLLLLMALLFVPLYVQASAWQAGFGQLGWYTVGRQTLDNPVLSGWQATVWVHLVNAVPWATLIIGIGLATIPRDIEEAALLESSPRRVLASIIVPQITGWLVVAALWTGIAAATELVVVDLFQIDTFARHLFSRFAQQTSVTGVYRTVLLPSLVGVTLVGCALWTVSARASARWEDMRLAPLRLPLGGARWPVFLVSAFIVALLTIVPMGNLVYQVGAIVDQEGRATWSYTTALRELISGLKEFRIEIGWTFLISALAATVSLGLAIGSAAIARSRSGLAAAPWLLAAVLVAIPAPLMGLWLIPLMNQAEWTWLVRLHQETVFSAVLAAALRNWPILFVLCWLAARDNPQNVNDLATLDVRASWQRLIYVSTPLLWPAWVLSWLVGFALASSELAATLMVLPPGASTVATRVYDLIHSGVREKEAALCLWHGFACIVLVAIGLRLHQGRHATLGMRAGRATIMD